jgi:hypothetical protein
MVGSGKDFQGADVWQVSVSRMHRAMGERRHVSSRQARGIDARSPRRLLPAPSTDFPGLVEPAISRRTP